ncbi:helix-turn-helix domain-containing protein [Natrononativus amylolyticus]|uniref:helix-turn-helix domain-containing protein n=1 Tax=Natrononativus amylolyticus TaxID=2963434 RepID=UPI0020CBD430|nr:bacterio-opsin activator domain-containing protein [Natrononativus amylolyticus]
MRQPTSIGAEEVLRVFDRLETPREPLRTEEVEDALGADGEPIDDVLSALAAQGRLETKRFGDRDRVWWRSRGTRGEEWRIRSLTDTLVDRVLEVSPIGIIVVDPAGQMRFANERAMETLGLTREEITARTFDNPDWEIYYDDGTPVPTEENPVARVLKTKAPVFGFEHWIALPDGSERWLSSNSAPVFDDEGEVDFVVVGFEDATELKRREEKLTSDHVRLLELRADRAAVPPSLRDSSDGEIRIDVTSIVTLPEGRAIQYMSTEDLSASEFVTAVEEVPHYFNVRLLSTSGGRTRVEAHAEPATVSEVFQSLGGRARAVIIDAEAVRFLGEIPGDVEPRAVLKGVRFFHPEVELLCQELVYSPRVLQRVVEEALTDRQFAALETAYYGGYFDSPRASTGDELAAHFGVTRQTFNQHLRKAERVVFEHLFEKSGEDAR